MRAKISDAICVLYHNDPLPTVYTYRKGLYDFYYTLVTLTMGYKNISYIA